MFLILRSLVTLIWFRFNFLLIYILEKELYQKFCGTACFQGLPILGMLFCLNLESAKANREEIKQKFMEYGMGKACSETLEKLLGQ